MGIVRNRPWWGIALAAALVPAGSLLAQNTKMPSTVRWGSGHVDVPSAGVLSHMALVGTVSGFWVSVDEKPIVGGQGQIIGLDGSLEKFYADGVVSFGLFDRAELGAVLHSLDDNGTGTIAGGYGQFALLRPNPTGSGIGLAVGLRAITRPDYDDNLEQATGRLGFPDHNLRQNYGPGPDVNTNWTEYAVASAFLKGVESSVIPDHDLTLSVGWGNGQFLDGDFLPWYSFADSEGWFGGATLHLAVSERALLNVSGDWNGFDLNLGAQLDLNGIRVGAHVLGANYLQSMSAYRSPKLGVVASLALCPGSETMLCRPRLIPRQMPDTIRLPAPPPDTVTITREVAPPLPSGTAASMCLATGETIQVLGIL